MACSILEITYSKFISDADGNLIRAVLLCDTAAELPGINDFSGYTIIQGSTCHVIADNQEYMMQSDGTWSLYGSGSGGGGGGSSVWGDWLSGVNNLLDECEALEIGFHCGYATFNIGCGVPESIEGLVMSYRISVWEYNNQKLCYLELLRGNGDRYFNGRLTNGWYGWRADYYYNHSAM